MASPIDSFKNNLFGQLKSYGDTVQGVFQERIARPLLALKRDLSRPSSTTRTSSDREVIPSSEQPTIISYEQPLPASTPIEIIDIEHDGTLKVLLGKFKSTFSPLTKRRTSEGLPIEDVKKPTREHRHSSISVLSNKTRRKNPLRPQKSVSFAEDIPFHSESTTTNHSAIVQLNERVQNFNNERTAQTSAKIEDDDDDDEDDFQRRFYQTIRPRRRSIGNGKDLIYQDLSAEIVAYVLKHALRAVEKENEELFSTENEDVIDLK